MKLSRGKKVVVIFISGILYYSLCAVYLNTYTFDIWDQQTWGYTAILDNFFVVHIRNVAQSGVSVYGPVANLFINIEAFLTLTFDILINEQKIDLITLSPTYIVIRKILLTIIHFLFSVFVYKKILRSRIGTQDNKKLIGLIFWIFNPVVVLVGSVWGQWDEVIMIIILSSFFYLYKKRYILSAFLLACSILFKAQGIIVVPLYIIILVIHAFIKNRRRINIKLLDDTYKLFSLTGFTFILTFLIFSLPYIIYEKEGYFRSVFFNLRIFPLVHMRGFNIWMLIFGDNTQIRDDEIIFQNISYYLLGIMTFLLISMNIYIIVVGNVIKGYKDLSYSLILRLLGIIYNSFFLFMTEIHERYIVYFYIPYLFVFILKFINSKIKLFEYIIFGTFTFVSSFNLLYVLYFEELTEMFSTSSLDTIVRISSILIILMFFTSLIELKGFLSRN